MPTIEVVRVSVTLRVRLAQKMLQEQMGDLVLAMGPNLAQQVHAAVQQEKLGYYPALDYFIQQGHGIDADLLSAAQHVAWLVNEFVRRKITVTLREPFSNIRFESTQPLSFSMPRVRPSDANALDALARHYAPYGVRLNLIASSIEKAGGNRDGYEKLVTHKIMRWLKDEFESVEISDARVLE